MRKNDGTKAVIFIVHNIVIYAPQLHMKRHTKIYLKHFGYGDQDFIPSEVSGQRAVDIHHIDNKGMGGSKSKDYIENLIALTREEHFRAHSDKAFNESLKQIHLKFLKQRK